MADEKSISKPVNTSVAGWPVLLLSSVVMPYTLIYLGFKEYGFPFPPEIQYAEYLDETFLFWFYILLALMLAVSIRLSFSSKPHFKRRAASAGSILSWLGLAVLTAVAVYWIIKDAGATTSAPERSLGIRIMFSHSSPLDIMIIMQALPVVMLIYCFRYVSDSLQDGSSAWKNLEPRIFKMSASIYIINLSLFCLFFVLSWYRYLLHNPEPGWVSSSYLLYPYNSFPYKLFRYYIIRSDEICRDFLLGFSIAGIVSGISYLRSRAWARFALMILSLIALSILLLTVLIWVFATFFSHDPHFNYHAREIYRQLTAVLYLLCFLVTPLVIVFRFLLNNGNKQLHGQQRMHTAE